MGRSIGQRRRTRAFAEPIAWLGYDRRGVSFVGLFGTVWGIMTSFEGIAASNNTSLAVVAPGIAEALFATALGLFAAIPAVVFYNRIGAEIGNYGKRLNSFIGVFEVELSRQLSKKGDRNGLRAA